MESIYAVMDSLLNHPEMWQMLFQEELYYLQSLLGIILLLCCE